LKHKSTIDKENDTKSLDTEKCGNLPTENDNIKMKNEDFENLKKESAGNDKLENKDSNKEEILKAEILNLNKGITRKTEKCSDLSAEIDEIKKEFKMLIKRHSEVKQNLAGITKKASESKKENENLKIEVDKLKRDAKLRRVQSEKTINKLQNEKEELRKTLNRGIII
jgi:chromosome segregation ATPase